jgi:hypothetical protein
MIRMKNRQILALMILFVFSEVVGASGRDPDDKKQPESKNQTFVSTLRSVAQDSVSITNAEARAQIIVDATKLLRAWDVVTCRALIDRMFREILENKDGIPKNKRQGILRRLISAMSLIDTVDADRMSSTLLQDTATGTRSKEQSTLYAELALDAMDDNRDYAMQLSERALQGPLTPTALKLLGAIDDRDASAAQRLDSSLFSRAQQGAIDIGGLFVLYARVFHTPLVPYVANGQIRALAPHDYTPDPNATVAPGDAQQFISGVVATAAQNDPATLDSGSRTALLFLLSLLDRETPRYAPSVTAFLHTQMTRYAAAVENGAASTQDLVQRWSASSIATPKAQAEDIDPASLQSAMSSEPEGDHRSGLVLQLMDAFIKKGNYKDALSLVNSLPDDLRVRAEDVVRLNIALAQLAKDDLQQALDTVRPCRDALIRTYIETLSLTRTRDGGVNKKPASVVPAFETLRAEGRTIANPLGRMYVFLGLAQQLASSNRDDMIAAFTEVVSDANLVDRPTELRPLQRTIIIPGQMSRVTEIYSSPVAPGDALRTIGAANFDDAAALARGVHDVELRSRILLGLAQGVRLSPAAGGVHEHRGK